MKKYFKKEYVFADTLFNLKTKLNSPDYKDYEVINIFIDKEGFYVAFLQKEDE